MRETEGVRRGEGEREGGKREGGWKRRETGDSGERKRGEEEGIGKREEKEKEKRPYLYGEKRGRLRGHFKKEMQLFYFRTPEILQSKLITVSVY